MKGVGIYKAEIVKQIHNFYGDLLIRRNEFLTIKNHLKALAEKHREGVKSKIPCTFVELNNYHPSYIGKAVDQLLDFEIPKEASYECVAYEHGFASWSDLNHKTDCPYNRQFEVGLDYLLNGNLDSLSDHLDLNSDIINQTSLFGHKAMLLHYTASNGVEFWRQQVPLNLPKVIELLIEKGADLKAKMKVYGGEYDTLSLLTSSAHPYKARVGKAAEQVLQRQVM